MYHSKSVEEIERELNTSKNGITEAEVAKRQEKFGRNEIPKPQAKTIPSMFVGHLKSPIVIILIIAAIFSIIVKSYSDSIFIFIVVIVNAVIGTYQEWSSQKNAEKLQDMIKIKVKVIRGEKQEEINSEDIVLGDIIVLESGDKIPADIRLIEANNLAIDESILTGESISRNKDTEINEENTQVADRTNIAYAGTIVTKGRGKGIAIAVGVDTEFGKVADKVLMSEDTKSPLVIRMDKFIKQISIGFVILAIGLSVLLYFKGYHIVEIFENVVALTVSSIPEGLTIAMTIVLSIASSKMAKKNVIVKELSAVESLGSCTVIATDKTGTLTANEQTAKRIILPTGNTAYIKGVGYNDIGEVEIDKNISLEEKNTFKEIVKLGMLNNEASLKIKDGKWVHHGDAIDIAFLALGYKMQTILNEEIVDRIPYESKLKYSAVFYKNKEDEILCTIKGATEKVLEFCEYMYVNGEKKKINKELILNQAEELAKQGFRVIAIARSDKLGTNDELKDELKKENRNRIEFFSKSDCPRWEKFLKRDCPR